MSIAPATDVKNALDLYRRYQFSRLVSPSVRQSRDVLYAPAVPAQIQPRRRNRSKPNFAVYDNALKKQIRRLEAQLAEAEKGGLQLKDPDALAAYLEQVVSDGATDVGEHLNETFNELIRSFNSQRESEARSAQRSAVVDAMAAATPAGGPAAEAVDSIQRMEEPAEY